MNTGGQILLRLDGLVLGGFINVPNTNGWQNWQLVELNNVYLPSGTHQLEARFFNGGFNLSHFEFDLISTNVDEAKLKPEKFELRQNYPNPFNSKTIITYSIPEDTRISLKLYDVLGNEVKTIVDDFKSAGTYMDEIDSSDLSSGSYFLNLKSNKGSITKKITVLK
jgi:hypothetical protein